MLITYLGAVAQNVTRSNIKVNRFVLSHGLSVHKSMMAGKAWKLTSIVATVCSWDSSNLVESGSREKIENGARLHNLKTHLPVTHSVQPGPTY